MGLKRTNYSIKDKGLTLDTAYAKIDAITVRGDKASAIIKIQQNREQATNLEALETVVISCNVDKEKPLHEQMYVKAKEDIFEGWEDDIVEVGK